VVQIRNRSCRQAQKVNQLGPRITWWSPTDNLLEVVTIFKLWRKDVDTHRRSKTRWNISHRFRTQNAWIFSRHVPEDTSGGTLLKSGSTRQTKKTIRVVAGWKLLECLQIAIWQNLQFLIWRESLYWTFPIGMTYKVRYSIAHYCVNQSIQGAVAKFIQERHGIIYAQVDFTVRTIVCFPLGRTKAIVEANIYLVAQRTKSSHPRSST